MERGPQTLRRVVFLTVLLVSFGLTSLGLLRALASAGLGKPAINFNIMDITQRRLARLDSASPTSDERLLLAVLGDSTVVSYPRGRQVPDRIGEVANRVAPEGTEVEIANLAVSGVAAFDYYFLADEIIRLAPDGVVFSFNVDTLSKSWRDVYARPELAGLIGRQRVGQALGLPIHWLGLTLDRFLFYVGVVQAGGYDAWYGLNLEQARVGRLRTQLRDGFDGLATHQASQAFDEALEEDAIASLFIPNEYVYYRFNAEGQLAHYGAALEGVREAHPVMQALGAMVESFEAAGIPVLVYFTPINVEHAEALGIHDPDGLALTIERVEHVVTGSGGAFVDLHDLLPDSAYRDAGGHFTIGDDEGGIDGPARVAEALAPALREHLLAPQSGRPHRSGTGAAD